MKPYIVTHWLASLNNTYWYRIVIFSNSCYFHRWQLVTFLWLLIQLQFLQDLSALYPYLSRQLLHPLDFRSDPPHIPAFGLQPRLLRYQWKYNYLESFCFLTKEAFARSVFICIFPLFGVIPIPQHSKLLFKTSLLKLSQMSSNHFRHSL